MGGRSPIFMIAAGALLLLNVGLGFALVQQRNAASSAHARAVMDGQLAQLEARLAVAHKVEAGLPDLRNRLAAARSRYTEIEPRLYKAEDKAVVEANLTRMASAPRGGGGGLTVDRIVTQVSDADPPMREHTFTVHLRGKVTLLPTFAEEFYRDPMLGIISRFGAVSPDLRYRDLDMVAVARYYEAAIDESAPAPQKEVADAFAVPEVGEAGDDDVATRVSAARAELARLQPTLVEAAGAEAQLKQYQKVVDKYQSLLAAREVNRRIASENLPKLYLRVRNSPLGGAALQIDGETVTFPDYAGEE